LGQKRYNGKYPQNRKRKKNDPQDGKRLFSSRRERNLSIIRLDQNRVLGGTVRPPTAHHRKKRITEVEVTKGTGGATKTGVKIPERKVVNFKAGQ